MKTSSQTVRGRELTCCEKVHLPPPVACHMSLCLFSFDKMMKPGGAGSVINWAIPSSFLPFTLYGGYRKLVFR